jgi:hypothetical protein
MAVKCLETDYWLSSSKLVAHLNKTGKLKQSFYGKKRCATMPYILRKPFDKYRLYKRSNRSQTM